MGSPMLLLWPKAPLRAVPEKVIEFKVSTPIAFDAAAITEPAFCAAALIDNVVASSVAAVIVLSRIRIPPSLHVQGSNWLNLRVRLYPRRAGFICRAGGRADGGRSMTSFDK